MTKDQVDNNLCAVGHKCPAGSRDKYAVPCPPGQYQPQEGKDVCIKCTVGNFCLGSTVHPIPCPAGYFCKEGNVSSATHVDNMPQPCEKGTYGHKVGLKLVTECQDCDPGFYCAERGADSPTGMCDAGYYCDIKSITPRPTGTGGNVCPAGGYCEQGSFAAKLCLGGYYNLVTGKKTINDCTLCSPGKYCQPAEGSGSATAGLNCADGYYCIAGSPVIDQNPAPPGTFSSTLTAWKAT